MNLLISELAGLIKPGMIVWLGRLLLVSDRKPDREYETKPDAGASRFGVTGNDRFCIRFSSPDSYCSSLKSS